MVFIKTVLFIHVASLSHFFFCWILDSLIEWCPINKVFSNETCERTCDDPVACISELPGEEEKCVCIGDYKLHEGRCISKDKCGCFISDTGEVLSVIEF